MAKYTSAYVPPPTPKPIYDPEEEPPKWDWHRIRYLKPLEDSVPRAWPKVGEQPATDDDPDWRGVVKNKIEKWPEPKEYNFGRPIPDHYWYFDTPDYADPFKKLGYAARWFAWSGLVASCLAGIYRGYKGTWPNHFRLIKEVGLPWFGSGMAATTVAITTANIRGDKDDYYNYAIAGFVFGSFLGARGDHFQYTRRVVLSIPTAIFIKHNAECNGGLMPMINFRSQNWGVSGLVADSWRTGDFRFGLRATPPDAGRDVEKRHV